METLFRDQFLAEVTRAFGFLRDFGFELDESSIKAGPTYVSVPFIGKHIAILVGYDLRDRVVDSYVAKVVDGRINRDLSSDGYWSDIYAYMVKYHGYRGAFGKRNTGSTPGDPIAAALDVHAAFLREHGEVILSDKKEVLPA